jgi:hypothetical protein
VVKPAQDLGHSLTAFGCVRGAFHVSS